jgi:hypothetical protein
MRQTAARRAVAGLVIGACILAGCSGSEEGSSSAEGGPAVSPKLVTTLTEYVLDHYQTPEDYISSKFSDHDIVFVGEFHRIKHDPELIQRVIPKLYEAGVYNLGMEFARRRDQDDIDRLVTGDVYDESLAKELLWREWPWWGFQEYADIFRAAWCLNKGLPDGARPFRIFGLNATQDWSHLRSEEDRDDPEVRRAIWPEGGSDEVMAETIMREFVDRGQRALVYSGINHAYTGYRQPIVSATGEFVRFAGGRMGSRVYDSMGGRCMTVFLHSPWPSAGGYSAPLVLPADGAIDAMIAALPGDFRRAGFDVEGTPSGSLGGETSLWSRGYDDFTLADYCDGYVIQGPLSRYEGVTVIPNWFTEENRREAIDQIANPDPRVKNYDRTTESLTEGMARDTDLDAHFGNLR